MQTLERHCPAKINLGLYVTKKRSDGYHNIETIFYPISLSDKLIIELNNTTLFRCNLNILETKDNLIVKAKNELASYVNLPLNCHISLEKNIPIGAGLGGGSSNAATTLLMLNELFDLRLSKEELKIIALNLGSDVPYFLNPVPSYGTSRGEVLSPVNLKILYPIVVINPGIHISTKWAYQNISPKPTQAFTKIFEVEHQLNISKLQNDFEEIVFQQYPQIAKIKSSLLERGALYSSMSGSGSTVFGIFPEISIAKEAIKNYPENYFAYLHSDEM
ncbi:MAG: 4-(cytidine 5'-diphospho)-2-C-methyl-D-erythritol kinase [Ignavibacteriales bacterium]|nr:MAG: 4-(cytidine 5'-diphospho)-2-C-methyl-D-erythritol kinase [Ignavibacteriales bacterium]